MRSHHDAQAAWVAGDDRLLPDAALPPTPAKPEGPGAAGHQLIRAVRSVLDRVGWVVLVVELPNSDRPGSHEPACETRRTPPTRLWSRRAEPPDREVATACSVRVRQVCFASLVAGAGGWMAMPSAAGQAGVSTGSVAYRPSPAPTVSPSRRAGTRDDSGGPSGNRVSARWRCRTPVGEDSTGTQPLFVIKGSRNLDRQGSCGSSLHSPEAGDAHAACNLPYGSGPSGRTPHTETSGRFWSTSDQMPDGFRRR